MSEDGDGSADADSEAEADLDTRHLAVVVAKPRAESVIDALETEGVYDDGRSVQSWDDDGVALPVTAPPETVEVRDIVQQVGERRLRSLDDHLRQRGWTDEELDAAPSSWAVVGSVVLVAMGEAPRPTEVGEALLALHGEADTVLARNGISGAHREPDVTVVAGEGDTETVHTEHGTEYALDLAEVMFSPGNKAERARMGEVVREGDGAVATEPSERASGATASQPGERVLDMFAGIGYFTLPMARAGAEVTAVEHNPTAFRYLVENTMRNGVDGLVHPYRADCREVVAAGLDGGPVDRVVMGYYESWEYLDHALAALTPGGTLHMHETTPEHLVFDRPIERLEAAAAEADRSVEILDTRRVKSHSEGVVHVVVDARID
ncbi:class I SAM-dependent methyltransferase [Haloarcula salinisoli]|uniref:tRNA(Phe) (4-demethylwyosine(37)-C(7)) aminocarboxypropyltransferase n=1 Tax=Haloarcula salinisoli TaxID=2487746 RepID=A0A8J7YE94_9EURY|nr:class I SAM-dependent methyltransferase family protein [Halomicroarcula salinisoli]MBX0286527.1 class I SAM-dependent methyltransferase family protein [Halomicroarcula salinisoli]MBX0303877.1 class I SAM-dependent methyltransferase family protein [Halomicroarcula salinisoli]